MTLPKKTEVRRHRLRNSLCLGTGSKTMEMSAVSHKEDTDRVMIAASETVDP